MAKKYYSLDKILEANAQWDMIIGERSNGKSHAVKEYVIKNVYNGKGTFVFLRRLDSDVKTSNVNSYFCDIDIGKLTNGRWNGVKYWQGRFYFIKSEYDFETDKVNEEKSPEAIGYAMALNVAERYKSLVYEDVTSIIFEEFMSRKSELPNEPMELQQLVSTVFRDRDGKVFMIGNTVSPISSYFTEWGLDKVYNQQPGTIDVYTYTGFDADGKERVTRFAVEYCSSSGSQSTMIFGKARESVMEGAWECRKHPLLYEEIQRGNADTMDDPRAKTIEPEVCYSVLIAEKMASFVMQLRVWDDGRMFLYVYPYTGKTFYDRVLTSEFSSDNLTSRYLRDTIQVERLMKRLYYEHKVCYSTNLTGDNFEKVMETRGGI